MDPLDLVRAFFHAANDADPDRVASLYHPACIVERIFVDDADACEGRDLVRLKWAAEFEKYAGGLAGGHRFEVRCVAGMPTGWGWARAEWIRTVIDRAAASLGQAEPLRQAGYSHFLIEDGLIRRQTSAPRGSEKTPRTPSRPVVGVGAVILTDDGRVVLVKRSHEPLAGQWNLPGGGLELGETLEAGTAREVLEETGLIVDVGPVVEIFDRILVDETGEVGYHFVLIDYLCRPRGGTLSAGSDVDAVALADPAALAPYRIAEKAQVVIARAVQMREGHP